MSLIEFKNVSKEYKTSSITYKALNNVNLVIEENKFVCILGPSGAGKSTLINLLGGLDSPTSGNIIVDENDISTLGKNALADYRAKTVGFVFQFYNLIPTLTALENVKLVKELSKDTMDPLEALESVGLKELANKFPQELSGGEQQRVSIARAIAKKPKILLCDEPTGALDSKTGVLVLETLKDLVKNFNTTVVVVTHNQNIALIADVVIKVKNGEISSIKSVDNLIDVSEVDW